MKKLKGKIENQRRFLLFQRVMERFGRKIYKETNLSEKEVRKMEFEFEELDEVSPKHVQCPPPVQTAVY